MLILSLNRTGNQRRIQDFQGGANPKGDGNLLFGQISPKTAWEWRILNRGGGGGGASKILLDYADPLLAMTEYDQI